jgi:hypothetical protein
VGAYTKVSGKLFAEKVGRRSKNTATQEESMEFILCNPLDTLRIGEHCRSDFLKNLLCGKENIEMFSEKSVSKQYTSCLIRRSFQKHTRNAF